jgi:ubiquinone/menaquinone biosynthesis C-methylase UbiE
MNNPILRLPDSPRDHIELLNGTVASAMAREEPLVRYVGIDISPTMFDEARRFNAALVAAGRASFHLASAEHMLFPDASFDRVFAIGVIHFWRDPVVFLVETRRVMRPGALAIMGTVDPRSRQDFARSEFGFHLRGADEWRALLHQTGFGTINVETIETDGITPDGKPNKRYTIRITSRP